DAAAVLGRTSTSAVEARGGHGICAGLGDALHRDHVLPTVAVVVEVDEGRTGACDRTDGGGPFIDHQQLIGHVRHPETCIPSSEVVQVRVRPAEGDLQDVVQRVQRDFGRHDESPPDGGGDVLQLDVKLHGAAGE